MRFATALSSAALASVALAMPTNEWHGESYGGNGKKHEHEVSPTAPEYTNTTAPVDVSPTQPTPYSTPVDVSPTTPTPSKPVIGDYPHKEVSPTTPGQYNGGNDCARNCITDQQADQGAEIFRQLIQNYTETLALSALTPDFEDYTSSVNIIRNRGNKGPIQVNGISFTSREDFMNAQGSQPQIPFDTLNVWHGCDTITVRWQTTDSAAGQPTKANNIVSVYPFALMGHMLTACTACTWSRRSVNHPSHRQPVWLPYQNPLL